MHSRFTDARKHGFSLVELSIVLVILGLLTGGILAGQSLIRAAELRSVTTQFANYKAAVYTFRDKYFALPGDFNKATSFWTSAGGTGADAACFAAQASTAATCNGDGDGEVADAAGDGYIERFMAWKHLANAGLVEGSYTGKSAGAANTFVPTIGSNVPPSKLSSGLFDIVYMVPASYIFTGSTVNRNTLTLYGWSGSLGGVILPEEAWNIDTKLDDGSPVTGGMFHFNSNSSTCVTSTANNATYSLTVKDKTCMPILGF